MHPFILRNVCELHYSQVNYFSDIAKVYYRKFYQKVTFIKSISLLLHLLSGKQVSDLVKLRLSDALIHLELLPTIFRRIDAVANWPNNCSNCPLISLTTCRAAESHYFYLQFAIPLLQDCPNQGHLA